jgi:putative heme-binding domain-containing protein
MRAPDDCSLFKVIREGIAQTEMAGSVDLSAREVWQLAAYIRTLGRTAIEKVPGDPAEGRRLFRTKGNCAACHTVNSEGGRIGPPLGEIGARRSAAYLRSVLLDPASALPEDFMQVSLLTRDGRPLTGIRVDEDTFSIQIRDFSDQLHSYWKSDLAALREDSKGTPMPSFRDVFSQRELDDLIAYLVSLRGGE